MVLKQRPFPFPLPPTFENDVKTYGTQAVGNGIWYVAGV